MSKKITRIGIGGPVGSGKTAIVEAITPRLLDLGIKVLIITNDVVTTEDAKHVQRTLKGILIEERILGVAQEAERGAQLTRKVACHNPFKTHDRRRQQRGAADGAPCR